MMTLMDVNIVAAGLADNSFNRFLLGVSPHEPAFNWNAMAVTALGPVSGQLTRRFRFQRCGPRQ